MLEGKASLRKLPAASARFTDSRGLMGVDKSEARVRRMFGQIAARYDLLNHLLSLGIDVYWRRQTVRHVPPRASRADPGSLHRHGRPGLGLLPCRPRPDAGRRRRFLPSDAGRRRRQGQTATRPTGVTFVEADAQQLPFADNSFQIVSVAFGLRNVTDTDRGLREMVRVCRPGGRVAVLEFSLPALAAVAGLVPLVLSPRAAADRAGPGAQLRRSLSLSARTASASFPRARRWPSGCGPPDCATFACCP